jgi:hypothetical protein
MRSISSSGGREFEANPNFNLNATSETRMLKQLISDGEGGVRLHKVRDATETSDQVMGEESPANQISLKMERLKFRMLLNN